jgi:hypothetical protein
MFRDVIAAAGKRCEDQAKENEEEGPGSECACITCIGSCPAPPPPPSPCHHAYQVRCGSYRGGPPSFPISNYCRFPEAAEDLWDGQKTDIKSKETKIGQLNWASFAFTVF